MPISITRTYSPESIRRATRIELVDDQVSPQVRIRIVHCMVPFVGKGAPAFELRNIEIPFDSTKPGEQQRIKDEVTAIQRGGNVPLKV